MFVGITPNDMSKFGDAEHEKSQNVWDLAPLNGAHARPPSTMESAKLFGVFAKLGV